ncbi:hypothetical protein [Bradyrhizobium sp. CCBAU 11361]|uniref:hypothetical protein n=1 Tax=Bradyrhizobium sp. CCBAU 11361 TaxID=1630812 RepID=UPI0023044C3E|nr:hypothetical protein [Bradyrhizobium sp. CCBAU 11361]
MKTAAICARVLSDKQKEENTIAKSHSSRCVNVTDVLGEIQIDCDKSDTDASLKWCSTPPFSDIGTIERGVENIGNGPSLSIQSPERASAKWLHRQRLVPPS